MNDDLRAADARQLQHLRRLTNWPLGESGFFARIELLARHPQFRENAQGQNLIENLADFYTTIHSTFDEFRPPFDPADTYRPQHPNEVRRAARLHFFELLTTTRFEVLDLTQVGTIIATKFQPMRPLELRHSVALAALGCVQEALEILEDSDNLQEAAASCGLAAMWLAHLETEKAANQRNRVKRAKQALQAAAKLRTPLTPDLVADYFKANPDRAPKALVSELMERYKVSERTVRTRLKEAKALKLLQ